MATRPLDMNEFTEKERRLARRNLLKKIEQYNKAMRKNNEPSFPLKSPTAQDLVYKGIMKITYDRGYAIQTKSILAGSNVTTSKIIEKLIANMGLTGTIDDYVLEERNHANHTTRTLSKTECPLKLKLQYGTLSSVLEIRLVKVNEMQQQQQEKEEDAKLMDEQLVRARRGSIPKDEVIDHGAAKVEITMEEALEDIPSFVTGIKDKLKLLSDTVVSEGKPHSGLPLSRRALWDILKPQVSGLVRYIRELVDTGEFLTTRHCPSEEFRLIVTLLLELITDYSRELIAVTKELCGLKSAAKIDFDTSVSNFVQQVEYVTKLVERTSDCIHASALSGHLLHATAPENFINGPLDDKSLFSGSGSISGVLLFTSITAYLGLIRAAYEDKSDYFAAMANNMLQSTQRTLEKVRKTNEYELIHLHPLRSRVADMEHKLKVSMDTLVKRVKIAASKQPAPVSVPELLLAGHNLIMATLDFLLVAQCASLLHKIIMTGRELLQLPWVRGGVTSAAKIDKKDDTIISLSPFPPSSPQQSLPFYSTTTTTTTARDDHSSNNSDSNTERSFGTLSTTSSGHRISKERKSRITSAHTKGEVSASASTASVNIEQLTIQPGHLPLNYTTGDSGEEADDEAGRSLTSSNGGGTAIDTLYGSSPIKPLSPHLFASNNQSDSTQYMGIDAVQRLRKHHLLNKAVTKVAESLLLKVTQSVNLLTQQCQENAKESYSSTVDDILRAVNHLREEVSVMECDVIGTSNIQDTLIASHEQLNSAIQALYMSLSSASSSQACDKDKIRLVAAVGNISDMCSKIIRDALSMITDHKKALTQAEKLEEEFISLMTGHKIQHTNNSSVPSDSSPSISTKSSRNRTSTVKLPLDQEADSVILEEVPIKAFMTGGTWTAASAPKVIGGTPIQLLQRLTYQRVVVDSEFIESFMLTFHCYLSNEQLLGSLIERYNVKPEPTSEIDQESIESDIIIPIRLRVLHAVRLWLNFHSGDFTSDKQQLTKMESFLKEVEREMPTCSQQLQKLLKGDRSSTRARVPKQSSQPIVPVIEGDKLQIMDCNTLELSRQLCLIYHQIFSEIQLKELSNFAWQNEKRDEQGKWMEQIPGIQAARIFSKNLSKVITSALVDEEDEEKQFSIISYFIKTAESCYQLKNYEGVEAIINGLTSDSAKTRGAWEFINDVQLQSFKSLQSLVTKDISRYTSELKTTHFTSPSIPLISVILREVASLHSSQPNTLPNEKDVLNFTKCRQLAKHLIQFHTIVNIPYTFMKVEIIQDYLQTLKHIHASTS